LAIINDDSNHDCADIHDDDDDDSYDDDESHDGGDAHDEDDDSHVDDVIILTTCLLQSIRYLRIL
jgi:hypothetical protein